jgi:hypothetical protein
MKRNMKRKRKMQRITLLAQHKKMLEQESAISPEVICERGYRSVRSPGTLERLGFGKFQRQVPTLLIPLWNVDGEQIGHCHRPDKPRVKKGKKVKYERRWKSRAILDVPPRAQKDLGNPTVALFITEGAKKVEAAVSLGLCCINIGGTYGWRGTNEDGGLTALADWESVAIKDRDIFIAFDSDVTTKPEVYDALARLFKFLDRKGGKVKVIYLPPSPTGDKQGLDDYFAAGGTVEGLYELAETSLRKPVGQFSSYFAKPDGIYSVSYTKDGPQDTRLTNFLAKIVADVRYDDGVEENHFFEIEAKMDGRTVRRHVQVSSFNSLNWVVELLGGRAIVRAGFGFHDRTREAIQVLSDDVDEKVVYTHVGWRKIDSEYFFLCGDGAIGAEGKTDEVLVRVHGNLQHYSLPEPPTGAQMHSCYRGVLELTRGLAPDHVCFPILASVACAVLGVTDFSIHLAGSTGVFKTEIASLIQRFFGPRMDARNLPSNWSSTANAILGMAFEAKDSVMTLDDLVATSAPRAWSGLAQKADQVLRAVGNQAGRQRMNADATLKPEKPPRCLILTTGEELPAGHSLRARIHIIEIQPGEVDVERLTHCQDLAAEGVFAGFTSAFLQWLAPDLAEKQSKVRAAVEDYRSRLMEENPKRHRRTDDITAKLFAAFEMILEFGVDRAVLSEPEADGLRERCKLTLREAVGAQTRHQQDAELTAMYLELICTALTSGVAHVATMSSGAPSPNPRGFGWDNSGSEPRPLGTLIGWTDGESLYLEPGAAFAAAQRVARSQGRSIPGEQKTLSKRLAEKGLLVTVDRGRGRNTIRKRIAGSRREVLHLSLDSVLHDVSFSEDPSPDLDPEERTRQWAKAFHQKLHHWPGDLGGKKAKAVKKGK